MIHYCTVYSWQIVTLHTYMNLALSNVTLKNMTTALETAPSLISTAIYVCMHVRTSRDINHPWIIYTFLELEMTAIHRLDSSRHTNLGHGHYVKSQANPPSQSPKGETSRLYAMLPIIQGGDQKTFFVFVECESMSKKKNNSQVSTSVWHQLLFLDCQLGISCRSA